MNRTRARNLKMLVVAAAMIMAVPSMASAVTVLTLTNPAPPDQQYQQTLNSPCVIGDPSCKDPAGWTHTDFPAGGGSQNYDSTSPDYTVSQISAIVGTSFIVGIDVNTTTQPNATEQLDLFQMLVNGVVQFEYNPNSPGTTLVTANNGNGFADELLSTFSLVGFAATDIVTFRAVVNNATDGREEFFLINTENPPPVIPEPASMLLLGSGLSGLAAFARRRRKV